MRRTSVLIMAVLIGLVSILAQAEDECPYWDYVNLYAPVVYFHESVLHKPRNFREDKATDLCTYVHCYKSGSEYVFQYWFYYVKDIRFREDIDQYLIESLETLSQRNLFFWVEERFPYWFHNHDWELLEVRVPELGSKPTTITYYAHGAAYRRSADDSNLRGRRPLAKVVSDMHGTYPPGDWAPWTLGESWLHPVIVFEFLVEKAKAYYEGHGYEALGFCGRCRPFSDEIRETHKLDGYPHEMPWDKNYDYCTGW